MEARLSERELEDLAALADGSLREDRRAEVEAWVAASPELQALVGRQRHALAATRLLAQEEPSPVLRAAVEAHLRSGSARRRRWSPRLAVASAVALGVAVVAAVLLTGGPAAPSVADAARLAGQPPSAPPPAPVGTAGTKLAAAVGGVAFPDFARVYGWRAVGARRGRLHGRDATVVDYGKDERRVAYVIVAGRGLTPPRGQVAVVGGVEYRVVRLGGRLAVTWRRGGHTCVLLGSATRKELLRLASWPLSPSRSSP